MSDLIQTNISRRRGIRELLGQGQRSAESELNVAEGARQSAESARDRRNRTILQLLNQSGDILSQSLGQRFAGDQATADRSFKAKEGARDRSFRAGEAAEDREFRAAQNQLDRDARVTAAKIASKRANPSAQELDAELDRARSLFPADNELGFDRERYTEFLLEMAGRAGGGEPEEDVVLNAWLAGLAVVAQFAPTGRLADIDWSNSEVLAFAQRQFETSLPSDLTSAQRAAVMARWELLTSSSATTTDTDTDTNTDTELGGSGTGGSGGLGPQLGLGIIGQAAGLAQQAQPLVEGAREFLGIEGPQSETQQAASQLEALRDVPPVFQPRVDEAKEIVNRAITNGTELSADELNMITQLLRSIEIVRERLPTGR